MNKEFKALCEKCPQLEELLKRQRENKLSKEKWLAVIRLFINTGRIKLARMFSKCSEKHDYKSNEIIDNLSIQTISKSVCCEELGCNEDDVSQCFGHVSRIKYKNHKIVNQIVNSPNNKVMLTRNELNAVGFYYSKSSKQLKINANTYARFILRNYQLMYHDAQIYYMYMANCWKPLSDFRMRKIMRSLFNKVEQDEWTTTLESAYMGTLCYECCDINSFKPSENYINIKNGLLDLSKDKIKLIPHNKMIFTTSQIPVFYDPESECPEFEKFLSDVFKGNKRLILLVQEIMGYCLSSTVKAHKMFIFIGTGSNGKSVLCDIMTKIAGGTDNVSNVSH